MRGLSQTESRPITWKGHQTFAGGVSGVDANVGNGASWYVDASKESALTGDGMSWADAFLTIAEGIAAASRGDSVYVMAKDITDLTTDPSSYAETLTIPVALDGLRLIGVSRGLTQGGLPQIKIGAGSTAMLTVRAPGCLIAGLGFNGASSTGGGILLDGDDSTKAAFGTTITGCHFKNCVVTTTTAASGGAIMWAAAGNCWQVRIDGNSFYKNEVDICVLGTSNSVPQDVKIVNNAFSDSPANTTCNIYTAGSGFGGGLLIDNNTFGALPNLSSGDTNLYTKILTHGTESSGLFSNNYFGALGTTAGWGSGKAAADIEDGIWIVHCYSAAGLIVREAT